MSVESDKQIADILATYGEPLAGNVWRVQGTAVIYHKTLERIAAQAQIAFAPPQILRAERDEAVILVTGEVRLANDAGTRQEWSIGEALNRREDRFIGVHQPKQPVPPGKPLPGASPAHRATAPLSKQLPPRRSLYIPEPRR